MFNLEVNHKVKLSNLKNFAGVLVVVVYAFISISAQQQSANPSPVELIKNLLSSVENVKSLEVDVDNLQGHNLGFGAEVNMVLGITKVSAVSTPLRYSASFGSDNGDKYEVAIMGGKTAFISRQGNAIDSTSDRAQSFASVSDAMAVLRLLMNQDNLKRMIADGKLLYSSIENVRGESCYLIVHLSGDPSAGKVETEYIWLSTKTGLPLATQSLLFINGVSRLMPRRIISNIRLNAEIKPEIFSWKPTFKDTIKAPVVIKEDANKTPRIFNSEEYETKKDSNTLIGQQLPNAAILDMEQKPLKLSTFSGKPTLLSLWSTWCGPCLKEMPIFQKLLDRNAGKLQVAALAISGTTYNDATTFIKKNPQYKFNWLLDRDWQAEQSQLWNTLKVGGLPTTLLIDENGKVIDQWSGLLEESILIERVERAFFYKKL